MNYMLFSKEWNSSVTKFRMDSSAVFYYGYSSIECNSKIVRKIVLK